MTKKEKITIKAKELLEANPAGLRFSELVGKLQLVFPGEPYGNFTGSIWNLDSRFPDEIYKPARGLFRLTRFRMDEALPEKSAPEIEKLSEEDFYQPFADWLVTDLEECTKAIPVGGNKFKEKWGTPDVFGIFKARESDIIKAPMEVIVGEIKINFTELITAFGQACAYKLFAHKSYLVVPNKLSKSDIDRLDSLCIICGIGLILFNSENDKNPDFEIRVRAAKHEPDTFYVNSYVKKIADELAL